MERCLETVHEITKLIKLSPKRDSIIKNIKHDASNDGQGMRLLCPTQWTIRAKSLTSVDCTSRVPYIRGLYEPSPLHQWTVRAKSLTSVSENYVTLQQTWDAAMEATKDTEVRARIGGVAAQMEKFEFFYGLELGRKILNIVDNLSRSLQGKYMCALDGQKLVQIMLSALQLMSEN